MRAKKYKGCEYCDTGGLIWIIGRKRYKQNCIMTTSKIIKNTTYQKHNLSLQIYHTILVLMRKEYINR